MEIMELFDESTMNLNLQGETKDQIIEEMVTLLDEGGVLADKDLDLTLRSRMPRPQQ